VLAVARARLTGKSVLYALWPWAERAAHDADTARKRHDLPNRVPSAAHIAGCCPLFDLRARSAPATEPVRKNYLRVRTAASAHRLVLERS